MADFDIAFPILINNEGDSTLNLDPNDPGNWTGGAINKGTLVGTKYGVIWSDYKATYGVVPTRAQMAALTLDQVKPIYKKLYWDPIHGDEIIPQHIAEQLFDAAVNTGLGSVPKLAAQALNIPQTASSGLDEQTIQILNSLANEKGILSGNNLA